MQAMKWILMLGLLGGAALAMAESTSGSSMMEYDSQSNSVIATCSIDPDYSTQANYRTGVACQINYTSTTHPTSSAGALAISSSGGVLDEITEYALPAASSMSSAGESYTAWGIYALVGINIRYVGEIPEFEDPYDYSYFNTDPPTYYTDDNVDWDPPGVEVVSVIGTILGWVPSNYIGVRPAVTTYAIETMNANDSVTFKQACPGSSRATCGAQNIVGSQPTLWLEEFQLYVTIGGSGGSCVPVGIATYYNGPPAPFPCT